jgi:pilus assembly protein CpaB
MSKMRIISLALAIGAAVVAGIIANGFIGPKPTQVETVEINKVKTVDVLVALKDIGMGEKLGEGTIDWKAWPLENVAETMITKEEDPEAREKMKEARSRIGIFQGETIMPKKIVAPGEGGFMSAILPKGMRAISVAVSERSSAGGFILPNDRVDVILTKKSSGKDNQTIVQSDTVLSNVRVLAINQTYQQEQDEGKIAVAEGKTATLELSQRQSEIIALVESSGELSLSLRSIAENEGKSIEANQPQTADKYNGNAKAGNGSDTLFVRYGIETYAQNR